ncbi:hypothetical protein BGP77_03005 [Saccharospirillum sp. MSK14-1]|uniref:hypothetical protein n=1 Tax=Saccharospirillum sp. MSK14-1 TaxID=1897632 RepID=UPI000D3863F0|nr:hypothetical protein [Saccharospirillum sp. MSK14-1]PTY36294.1 hypothetical protein BGP77_03005 [Saccharospirillum sp. MSK14-1]
MKPRYFQGIGEAPAHLSHIFHDRSDDAGRLQFKKEGHEFEVAFESTSDLLSKLQTILTDSVPLSVGGNVPGPVDEVGFLIESGKLQGPYIEISWSAPGCWTVREIIDGALEWKKADCLSDIVNQAFNPESLAE